MTQQELAEPRYTHAYVSTIEAGRRKPSRAALEHFASKLGIDVEELASGRAADLPVRLELRLQEARVEVSAGRFEQARDVCLQVGKEAKRFALARLEAKADEVLGLAAERRGELDSAIEHYDRAEALLESEPLTARASVAAAKARCFHMRGDVRYAIYLLESLLDSLERQKLRDPDALVTILAPLVLAYFEFGLPKRAASSAADALRLAPKVSDPVAVATMHVNVARVLLYQRKFVDAEQSLRRAQDLFRQSELETEVGIAHLTLAYALIREENPGEARPHLETAIATFDKTSNRINEAHARNELARLERLEGNLEEARKQLRESIDLLGDEGDVTALGWAYRELGLCEADVDSLAAEKNLRKAIEVYERGEEKLDLAATYRILGDVLVGRGQAEAGCDAYRTGIISLEGEL